LGCWPGEQRYSGDVLGSMDRKHVALNSKEAGLRWHVGETGATQSLLDKSESGE
jgi:hypothetical protein